MIIGFEAAFAKLGLAADADARTVRHAYARLLKQIDQANEIEAFQSLREAYDLALRVAQGRVPGAPITARPLLVEAAPLDAVGIPSPEDATFDDFAARLAIGLTSVRDATALLQQLLDSTPSLAAGSRFERQVAARLLNGWQPGHELLFEAAREFFHWGQDRGHLKSFGQHGVLLQAALTERQLFMDQPPDALERQRWLIRRLRNPNAPTKTLRRDERPLLHVLVNRYPHWLQIVTSMDNIQRWLGGPDALLEARAAAAPSRFPEAEPPFSPWKAVGFLLWLIYLAWRYIP